MLAFIPGSGPYCSLSIQSVSGRTLRGTCSISHPPDSPQHNLRPMMRAGKEAVANPLKPTPEQNNPSNISSRFPALIPVSTNLVEVIINCNAIVGICQHRTENLQTLYQPPDLACITAGGWASEAAIASLSHAGPTVIEISMTCQLAKPEIPAVVELTTRLPRAHHCTMTAERCRRRR